MKSYWSGEPELRILKSLVNPNKNSIDVGANNGVYTYFLSRLSSHVFAYEPNPNLAQFLEKLAFQNVTIFPVAVSDVGGTATLSVPTDNESEIYQLGGKDKLGSLKGISGYKIKTFEVPVVRLDDQNHHDIGFIKIDVEGYEEFVISGASEILSKQKPNLLVEIEQRHINKNISEIFSKIIALGYEGYFLLNRNLIPLDSFSTEKYQKLENLTAPSSLGVKYVCNFIFKPKVSV
ncbi:FkbM family methyltransferase [Halotia wernerae UHCC 0503]|nr:FkbM family methyltransferase [Halotia wernerae UHCC 0503]